MDQFIGTKAVSRAARIRRRRARALPAARAAAALPGRCGRAVQGRAVEPDLQADHAAAHLRDARQAGPGGQAAAVGARDRARVPRHARAARHRRAGAAHAPAVRGRVGHRPRLLRDGVRRGPRAVGPVAARHDAAERGADLRRDEPRDRGAAQRRRRRRRPGRLRQAGQLLRAPDRALEQAVPWRRSPSRSRRWTG